MNKIQQFLEENDSIVFVNTKTSVDELKNSLYTYITIHYEFFNYLEKPDSKTWHVDGIMEWLFDDGNIGAWASEYFTIDSEDVKENYSDFFAKIGIDSEVELNDEEFEEELRRCFAEDDVFQELIETWIKEKYTEGYGDFHADCLCYYPAYLC